MEMPTVGRRCAHEDCKRLDFLPLTCTHCALVFCKDHHSPGRHSCANVEDRLVSGNNAPAADHFRCAFPLCLARSPLEMPCPACTKHFCLEHRHHGCIDIPAAVREREREKWDAPRRLFEAAKAEADRQVSENLSRVAAKGSSKTAAKVRLMRLKARAVGPKAVPPPDRLHFTVHPPACLRAGGGREVFVARQWTVGRAIDSLAELCRATNRNNEPASDKLRLFRRSDGAAISPAGTDRTMEELLAQQVVEDGETLVLEYVPDGSTAGLEDVTRYPD